MPERTATVTAAAARHRSPVPGSAKDTIGRDRRRVGTYGIRSSAEPPDGSADGSPLPRRHTARDGKSRRSCSDGRGRRSRYLLNPRRRRGRVVIASPSLTRRRVGGRLETKGRRHWQQCGGRPLELRHGADRDESTHGFGSDSARRSGAVFAPTAALAAPPSVGTSSPSSQAFQTVHRNGRGHEHPRLHNGEVRARVHRHQPRPAGRPSMSTTWARLRLRSLSFSNTSGNLTRRVEHFKETDEAWISHQRCSSATPRTIFHKTSWPYRATWRRAQAQRPARS